MSANSSVSVDAIRLKIANQKFARRLELSIIARASLSIITEASAKSNMVDRRNKRQVAVPLFGAIAERNDIRVSEIVSEQHALSAFRLIYREYFKKGYCRKNDLGMHYSLYSLFPTTRMFMVGTAGRVLGTLTLVGDSPCGLPMENVFPDEVAGYRKNGKKIMEVSLFAVDPGLSPKGAHSLSTPFKLNLIAQLAKAMSEYTSANDIAGLLAASHPKTEELYLSFHFKRIGDVKAYRGAQGNPAIPMYRDNAVIQGCEMVRAEGVVERCAPLLQITNNPIAWQDTTLKKLIYGKHDIIDNMTFRQKAYLKTLYPTASYNL